MSEVLDRIKGVASEAIVKQVGAIYLFDVKGMLNSVFFLKVCNTIFFLRLSQFLISYWSIILAWGFLSNSHLY